jgi:hypothetical protein
MLAMLTPEELRLVLAHEFGHISGNHGRFSAWIYRITQTWQRLSEPATQGSRRRALLAWFLGWYPSWLATLTLPLRRRHEFEADAAAAALDRRKCAEVLLKINWISYRLGREFWPAQQRVSAREELPPSDIFSRMVEALRLPAREGEFERWRRRQSRAKTHIEHEHPCLAERLAAIGHVSLLEDPATACPSVPDFEQSALALLGAGCQRQVAGASAIWKGTVISDWRVLHAQAEAAMKEAQTHDDSDSEDASRLWKRLRVQVEYCAPEDARALLETFVAEHPEHAPSCYELGEMLLDEEDERGVERVEQAMRFDSDYRMPGLLRLLEYYRGAGEETQADVILRRLQELEKTFSQARRERARIHARDEFLAHELAKETLEKINRVLYFYPRVQRAWLVRKRTKHVQDKPAYVLALWFKPWDAESDRHLTEYLAWRMPVSCTGVALGGFSSRRLHARLCQLPGAQIYSASQHAAR